MKNQFIESKIQACNSLYCSELPPPDVKANVRTGAESAEASLYQDKGNSSFASIFKPVSVLKRKHYQQKNEIKRVLSDDFSDKKLCGIFDRKIIAFSCNTLFVFFMLFISLKSVHGQQLNLARNFSFESWSDCPVTLSDFTNYVNDWVIPGTYTSPDYFNSCSPFNQPTIESVNVPNTHYGYQNAYFGNGYAGVYTYYSSQGIYSYREYIESELFAPLLNRTTHSLSMRVNLADSSYYATIGPQMSLQQSFVSYNTGSSYNTIYYLPPVLSSSTIIANTLHWPIISQNQVQVAGGERYIVIGNFYDNYDTQLQPVNSGAELNGQRVSYYYIEDVWVSPDTIAWGNDTICENDSTKIWAYPCNDFSYAWSSTPYDPSLAGQESDSAIYVLPEVTTLYQVIVTDFYNNIDTGYVTITVLNAPESAEISGPISKCDDPGVFTIEDFDSAVLYSWSTDDENYTITPTDTFSVDWGSDLNAGYLYVMSTDTSTGCSTVDSVFLYQCCSDTSMIIWADTSLVFNGNSYMFSNIIVKDTVYISGSLFISNSQILMNPDATLILNPNAILYLERDTVIPCGDSYMWNSIIVSHKTAEIHAGTTIFSGGKEAIVSVGGGVVDISSSCVFTDNYIGIHFKPFVSNHLARIVSALFQCTGNANMLPPHAGQRSYAGIVIDSVESITIGVPNNINYLNTFDNLDYGIKSTASNLTVYNNYFKDLALSSMPFLPPGYGIYSENQTATAKSLVVGTSATGTYNDNLFWNCHAGVYIVKNQNISIVQNAFDFTGHTAVYFESCLANTISIEYNIITRGIYGVYGRYLRRYSNNNILHNTITNSGTGICIENDILAKAPLSILFNNIITPGYIGIKTTNISNSADVSYNDVQFNLSNANMNNAHFGILVQNSPQTRLYGNAINNLGTTITTNPYNLQGIAVQTTTEADLCDNDATKLGYGVCFTGYCNSSKIKRTDMTSCYTGIRLESATIGTQGLSTQPWDNRWYTNAGPYRIAGSPAVATNWYYRTSNNAYLISPYSVSPSQYLVPSQTNPTIFMTCGMIPLSSNISTASIPDSNKNDKYYAELSLLRSEDEIVIDNFETEITTPDLSLIENAVSAFEEGDSTVFEEKTDSIVSSELQAINHVTVNEILARFAETGILTASDSIVLLDIAYMDPIEGGEAVYTAQVLLGVQYVPVYPDVNNRSMLIQLEENTLKVYPNPVSEELTIECAYSSEFLLQVYSVDGKLILTQNIADDNILHTLDVSRLEKGMYRLKIIDKLTGKEQSSIFAKE